MTTRFSILLNAALFQAGWWACVVSAAQQRTAQAALALAAVVTIQIVLHAAPLRARWLP